MGRSCCQLTKLQGRLERRYSIQYTVPETRLDMCFICYSFLFSAMYLASLYLRYSRGNWGLSLRLGTVVLSGTFTLMTLETRAVRLYANCVSTQDICWSTLGCGRFSPRSCLGHLRGWFLESAISLLLSITTFPSTRWVHNHEWTHWTAQSHGAGGPFLYRKGIPSYQRT